MIVLPQCLACITLFIQAMPDDLMDGRADWVHGLSKSITVPEDVSIKLVINYTCLTPKFTCCSWILSATAREQGLGKTTRSWGWVSPCVEISHLIQDTPDRSLVPSTMRVDSGKTAPYEPSHWSQVSCSFVLSFAASRSQEDIALI